MKKIRVLVVDDSALVRKLLVTGLSHTTDIDVIHAAADPYEARDVLVRERPDVITLDIEMPKMDGVTFLKKFMNVLPTPTIIISSLAEEGKKITIEALESGAIDIAKKPKFGLTDSFPLMIHDIAEKIRMAARVKVRRISPRPATKQVHICNGLVALEDTTDQVIAIGSSTGGVEALARIIPKFPAASPGIVIVQHMPEGFTASFAKRLNSNSAMHVKEAEDGDRIKPGTVLIAPGGKRHMSIKRVGGHYLVCLEEGEKVSFSCPAVDVLFHSVALHAGKNCAAVVMTGMGKDGAQGLKAIKNAGGGTLAQDEESCVIFGMPYEAQRVGAADALVSLEEIPMALLKALKS